ncbi:hypothetical protein DXG01_016659 [Tephrocybe rancida]|nr:hypothetical protein DXG01_016659 [Tephrocybe rancida]
MKWDALAAISLSQVPKKNAELNKALKTSMPIIAISPIRSLCLRRFQFSLLSDRTQELLYELSHITSLDCFAMTFPALEDMLVPYPKLKELKVDGVVVRNDDDDDNPQPQLQLQPQPYPPIWPALPLALNSLDTIGKFIAATGDSLEHLNLRLECYDKREEPFKFDENTRLKTLTLSSWSGDRHDACWDELVLATHPQTQIIIAIMPSLENEQDIKNWDTSAFEKFFSRHTNKNISLKLRINTPKYLAIIDTPAYHDSLKSRFPELHARGLIQTEVFDSGCDLIGKSCPLLYVGYASQT